MPLKVDGDAVVKIRDIAEVKRTFKDVRTYARVDGKPRWPSRSPSVPARTLLIRLPRSRRRSTLRVRNGRQALKWLTARIVRQTSQTALRLTEQRHRSGDTGDDRRRCCARRAHWSPRRNRHPWLLPHRYPRACRLRTHRQHRRPLLAHPGSGTAGGWRHRSHRIRRPQDD